MVTKILAWSSFGTMLLFAILAVVGLYAWNDLGDSGPMVVWSGVGLLVISILLAVALLVWATWFDTGS